MFNKSKKAFSLVELLVVITILAIIWAIWVSINDWYKEKTYNTKVVTDLSTIENTFIRYKQENSSFPSPEGNLKYITSDWSYAHDETEAYGFHWYITESTIPKRFISILPRDPKTNQYYVYGKTISWKSFEVAGVLSYWDKYESITKWNYIWKEPLYNLIREYNWPDFVYDKSKNNFPYNPEEMILTAKISSFTGNLTLNNTITDKNIILERQLIPWDNIKLSTWSTAIIYYSDWTVSYLWDNETPLELTLSVMKYKKDDNLFTRIRLALNFWTILTKASKMSPESNFDIYTVDTEASVRWTIFEIKRIEWENKTTVKVIKWSLFVNSINISNYEELLKNLKNDQEINPKYPIILPISSYVEIVPINWYQESILKEWGVIDIFSNWWASELLPQDEVEEKDVIPEDVVKVCDTWKHKEGDECVSNIRDCNIDDWNWHIIWTWKNSWNVTRWDCIAESCIDWYNEIENECVKENICPENKVFNWIGCILKTKTNVSCTWLPTNAFWNNVDNITQNWNWNKYTPSSTWTYSIPSSYSECMFKCKSTFIWKNSNCVCPPSQHIEWWICKNNTISCIITNWTWQKTWNTATQSRPVNCSVNCNPWFVPSWNSCVCPTDKHLENWSCVSNTRYNQSCSNLNYSNASPKISKITQNRSNWRSPSTTTRKHYNSNSGWCEFECKSTFSWNWSNCVCPSWTHLYNWSCLSCPDSTYQWDSSVKKCKKTVKVNWCWECPNWYSNFSDNRRLSACYWRGWGNRYLKRCNWTETLCWAEPKNSDNCKDHNHYWELNPTYDWNKTIYVNWIK